MRTFHVYADFYQFYLMDADVAPNIPEEVTDEHMRARVRTAPHIVVFRTESASQVPVEVAVHHELSAPDWAWDHYADFELSLPSGTMVLCGCTDYVPDSPHISVGAFDYHGRAFFANAASGTEQYRIALWPAMAQPSNPADA